tara:strand:- start:128 stop:883 length:756 start_codon:yes stop_codon:yes gene_type:complete
MVEASHDMSEPQEVVDQRAAEEADSLRIGEELAQHEQQLLAGKYRDAEELEKAYLELQQKMGTPKEEVPQQEVQPEQPQQEYESLLEEAYEVVANDGQLTDEQKQQLMEISKEDLIEAYLNSEVETNSQDLSDAEMNSIYDSVGGQEQYKALTTWAADNWQPQEIEAYDQAIESGNMNTIYFALQSLFYRYSEANGSEGQTLMGRNAPTTDGSYRSQSELIKAMSDPRYEDDPAYRNDVLMKLENSPELQF